MCKPQVCDVSVNVECQWGPRQSTAAASGLDRGRTLQIPGDILSPTGTKANRAAPTGAHRGLLYGASRWTGATPEVAQTVRLFGGAARVLPTFWRLKNPEHI